MKAPYTIAFLLLTASWYSLLGQSNQGQAFWFGFMEHVDQFANTKVVMISSLTQTSGEVSMPLMSWSQAFSVTPGEVTIVQLPIEAETVGSETITRTGVHVNALAPISVYIHQYHNARSEAAAVLPTHALGHSYYTLTYQGVNRRGTDYPSEMLIVASQDETHVTVTLSSPTKRGKKSGDAFTIILDAGETYQIQGQSDDDDLTGSHVTADKDFALFAGAVWTEVPTGCSARDNLLEQMYPVSTWGRQYVSAPSFGATYDLFRILASEDGTKVTVSSGGDYTLDAGEFVEYNVFGTSAFIQANKPILIGQLNIGQSCNGHGIGDPSLVLLNSIEQTRDTVTLFSSRFQNIEEHYLNIITRTADVAAIILDDVAIAADRFAPVLGNNDFSYAVLPVGPGKHHLTSQGCGVLATAYGYGNFESYAYGGGASFSKLNANPIPEGGCLSDTIFFDAGLPTQRYDFQWDLGDGNTRTEPKFIHQYDNLGSYDLSLVVYDQCLDLHDTSYQTLKVTLRQDIQPFDDVMLCEADTLELGAFDLAGARYEWEGPLGYTSDRQFPIIHPIGLEMEGTFLVTGIVSGCATYPQPIRVEVVPLPKPDLGPDTIVCKLIGEIELTPGHFSSYSWQDGSIGPTLMSGQDGLYSVTVANDFGCRETSQIVLTQRCPTRIFVPNAFTPNGDQINDQFEIFAEDITSLQWRIFDRYGNLLFESSDPQSTWNGMVDGKLMDAGSYIWTLQYQGYDISGDEIDGVKSGVVNLLR